MQNYDEDSYNEDKLKFDVKYPKELLTYLSCTLHCYSDREAWRLRSLKTCVQSIWQEQLCHGRKSSEPGTRSCDSTKKCPVRYRGQSRSMAWAEKHRYVHETQSKSQKFEKNFFKLKNIAVSEKIMDYGNTETSNLWKLIQKEFL